MSLVEIMDYRKPAVFGENWSPSRYKVLPYFAPEKSVIARPEVATILDLGCANGWNMSRFNQYKQSKVPAISAKVFGLDMVPQRVKLAQEHGPVMVASGLELPLVDESVDMVYVQHVLHHIGNVEQALSEAYRVLKPGGFLFLIETVEDNPIIRWGRRAYPSWLGDEINAQFTFAGLQKIVGNFGFQIQKADQYSVFFWIWEIVPDQFPVLERLTPIFVGVERLLVRLFRQYGAHSYLVAQKI